MPTVIHQTQSSYIHCFPDLKLSWSGDYESLKLFVDSELNLQGKWTSTGEENKLFESDNVDIHWRAKKKFLRIEGKQASEVKRSLLMMILHDTGFDDHILVRLTIRVNVLKLVPILKVLNWISLSWNQQ